MMIRVSHPHLRSLGNTPPEPSNLKYYVIGSVLFLGGLWLFSDMGGREAYRQARYGKVSGYKGERYRRDLLQRQKRLRRDVDRIRKDSSLTASERKSAIAQTKREYKALDRDLRRARRRVSNRKRPTWALGSGK